ncbi:hypothetical protein GCM10007071_02310 [Marinobacter zhanjiangensis]|uniref:Uncharacterized protein n=1 Tax=Marinobacter zhanjiangensis TaxID=578215 RepID=A0ABQ3AK03_9GAMM|nr:hypothetical protein GCM10007071_02310 [Marinobacter zhanjiangensis]
MPASDVAVGVPEADWKALSRGIQKDYWRVMNGDNEKMNSAVIARIWCDGDKTVPDRRRGFAGAYNK